MKKGTTGVQKSVETETRMVRRRSRDASNVQRSRLVLFAFSSTYCLFIKFLRWEKENGLVVPDVILLLKDCLKKLSGYSTEGIFRKAGLESEMKTLKETINNGSPFVCDNVHSIATLLKVFFFIIFLLRLVSFILMG